jgi:putative aldouronate transport system substrate-binding protein
VYQPWLDALGLEEPETIDEFHEMLLAFKNDDPNGNGVADEIPLSAAMGRPYYNNDTALDLYIMNAFTYDDA